MIFNHLINRIIRLGAVRNLFIFRLFLPMSVIGAKPDLDFTFRYVELPDYFT